MEPQGLEEAGKEGSGLIKRANGVRAREPQGWSVTFLVPRGSRSTAAGVRLDILEQRLVGFADDCGMGVSFVSRTQE